MGLVAHGLQNLPGPGIEPMSPALAGELLSTKPQRSPNHNYILKAASPYTSTLGQLGLPHMNLGWGTSSS